MRFLILTTALVVMTVAANAASSNTITADQTSNKIGECMTVEGQVSLRPSHGRFGADLSFDSANGFIGHVPQVEALGDLSRFDGRTVDLTGIIEPGAYSLTEIQVTSPEQIMMADETPDHLLTCDHF